MATVETGIIMKRHTGTFVAVAISTFCSTAALAAKLPQIKTAANNTVPECATPGRMMDYLKSRNSSLDGRFEQIAVDYMRHGEELGLRWDYAFFQMIVETGNLSFKRGNGKFGDVKPGQNNFAGLGATGGGEPGESFKDISSGVKAHLEHVLMYTGERIDNPTADRTRKVQEWGVLTSWQKTIKGPMTFTDLTRKWAPSDRSYSDSIESVGDKFYEGFCSKADPRPELLAEARKGKAGAETKVASAAKDSAAKDKASDRAERVSGAELARRAVEDARAEGNTKRSALGAGSVAAAATADSARSLTSPEPNKTPPMPAVTVLNAPRADEAAPAAAATAKPAGKDKGGSVQTAAAAQAARQLPAPAAPQPAAAAKCNVWTASYGGQKAVIIKAVTSDAVNYTVLDVNEGSEKRETEAYIAAYAKEGQAIAEFGNQSQALDKAFELCPEG